MLRRIGRIAFPFHTKSVAASFSSSSSSSSSCYYVSTLVSSCRLQRTQHNLLGRPSFISLRRCFHQMYTSGQYSGRLSSGIRGNLQDFKHVISSPGRQQRTYNPCAVFKNKSPRKATGNKKCRTLKTKKAAAKRFLKTAYGLKCGQAGVYENFETHPYLCK